MIVTVNNRVVAKGRKKNIFNFCHRTSQMKERQ